MSGRPNSFMKMYWGDYFADTRHLSTLQHGAYLLLIAHYWNSGKPLPDNDRELQRIVGIKGAVWKNTKPLLASFFKIADGVWSHKRIDAELRKANENYAKKVASGNTPKNKVGHSNLNDQLSIHLSTLNHKP